MSREKERFITGSTGLVASKVIKSFPHGEGIVIPGRDMLDITKKENILEYFEGHKPRLIINFAAYTNVDEAEKQRLDRDDLAWKVNAEGAMNLAMYAQNNDLYVIHISTDFVFPGTEAFHGPYLESTKTTTKVIDNLSWYGYTKLMGEWAVRNSGARHAIVRISYPFGNPNTNKDFALKTLSYIQKGYGLFDDQDFTPTYIPDLAKVI